jgi:hypothetical protein
VANLAGIIICDTFRPTEYPGNPNAPDGEWGGVARLLDDDTTRIVLNSFVPAGYELSPEDADNTVCHEMMHAYLRGVEDNYDSDANSCVWGNLLAPGPTDKRLMREQWPARVAEPTRPVAGVEPSWPERVRDAIPDVELDLPDPSVDFPGVDGGLQGGESDRVPPTLEPTVTPQRSIATAAPTASTRSGCDPAYPEARTCIPPGPPLEFPCAITEEREFIVLPPDPRGLDYDDDGIGCEPMVSS